MKGFVDDELRALLPVPVTASRDGDRREMLVWIDTAFNGGLVIPRKQIAELGLVKESSAEAILADGNCVELETFSCFFDWFGLILIWPRRVRARASRCEGAATRNVSIAAWPTLS